MHGQQNIKIYTVFSNVFFYIFIHFTSANVYLLDKKCDVV